jgi:hypothetical protein
MSMYADDGYLYGVGTPPDEEEIMGLNSDKHGITINKKKSG